MKINFVYLIIFLVNFPTVILGEPAYYSYHIYSLMQGKYVTGHYLRQSVTTQLVDDRHKMLADHYMKIISKGHKIGLDNVQLDFYRRCCYETVVHHPEQYNYDSIKECAERVIHEHDPKSSLKIAKEIRIVGHKAKREELATVNSPITRTALPLIIPKIAVLNRLNVRRLISSECKEADLVSLDYLNKVSPH